MDKPTPRERAEHILNALKLIREFVNDVGESAFLEDLKIQSAVQFQFLIIAEAVRNIDDEILAKYKYPWHIPRSFRNFIIHVYHGIKMERIYNATQDLDELEKQVRLIVAHEFEH
ncbi:MAG: HepT-like ribonuclease domain-containing protein [Saprospiraceae bacterium]